MAPDVQPEWQEGTEVLTYQFGSWVLGRWTFSSLINRTNPLIQHTQPVDIPAALRPITYQQMRDDGTISSTICFTGNNVRYVPYHGTRYFIDLRPGSFNDYLSKFSSKSRNTLKRKLRQFVDRSEGKIDFRIYTSPDDVIEFRRQALKVSALSYQNGLGFGIPESPQFETHLLEESAKGRMCGFVLFGRNTPVAYVFCRVDQGIVTYSYCGYDPEFAKLSPGTVLLFLIVEWLFRDGKFKMFDLGNDSWDYKAALATGGVKYFKVIWFPKTAANLIMIGIHIAVLRAWFGAARVRKIITPWSDSGRTALRSIVARMTDVKAHRAEVVTLPNGVTHRRVSK